MEDPEGSINEQKVNEWINKSEPILNKYEKRIVDNQEYSLLEKRYNLFKILVILFAIACLVFGFMAYDDKFKTDVVCESTIIPECPDCICPNCPDLSCPTQDINISYNITFPNNLNINMS